MALLTWLAVNPTVFVFSRAIPPLLGLPALLELLIVNALVVASLTWLLMPTLTRLAKSWLVPRRAMDERQAARHVEADEG